MIGAMASARIGITGKIAKPTLARLNQSKVDQIARYAFEEVNFKVISMIANTTEATAKLNWIKSFGQCQTEYTFAAKLSP